MMAKAVATPSIPVAITSVALSGKRCRGPLSLRHKSYAAPDYGLDAGIVSIHSVQLSQVLLQFAPGNGRCCLTGFLHGRGL